MTDEQGPNDDMPFDEQEAKRIFEQEMAQHTEEQTRARSAEELHESRRSGKTPPNVLEIARRRMRQVIDG